MDAQKMQVTLMCEDRLYGVLLPEKAHSRYWIEDVEQEATDQNRKLISVEGENGVWKVTAGRKLQLFDPNQEKEVPCLELEAGRMYPLILSGNRRGYVFTEPYTRDGCTYTKYQVPDNIILNIGKSAENQIVIDNPYISLVHAQLSLAGDIWTIHDNNSKNGIYVNGKRLHNSAILHPGNVLYILGVRIVIGYRFIALNHPKGTNVLINADAMTKYKANPQQHFETPDRGRAPGGQNLADEGIRTKSI